jgi:hypothetical protein
MAELLRADKAITNFRIRLGEPRLGTFRTVRYDGINDNVDELLEILNEAQRHVTWICYSANHALLEDTFYIEVLNGVTRYTLPELFLGPVAVFHHSHGQEYEVERANLFEVRAQTRSQYSDYVFRYYEIREQVPIMSAPRGIVAEDSENRVVGVNMSAVRVGDTVHNLTDDSQGIVNATFPSLNTVSVEKMTGGKTNIFQKGDIYQIDMAEKTRDAIDFWPQINVDDFSSVYTGLPRDIILQEDNVLFQVQANIQALPSGFEQDEQLTLKIFDEDDRMIVEGAREGLIVGTNDFTLPEFPDMVQLREDVAYTTRVFRADNGDEVPVNRITLITRDIPPSVEVRNACLPRPMVKRTDYCEIPIWAMNAVYAYAHIIAQKKMSRNPNADRGLMEEFLMEVDNIKSYKFKLDERNTGSLMLGNRRRGWNFPGNYGTAGPSPWDLF